MKKEKKQKSSKYSLLKVIGITFVLFAILTWIIPAGVYNGTVYTKNPDGTLPVGLFGLFINPLYAFAIFAQYFLVLLAIGGFYGVINKTGVYTKVVNKISGIFKKHKTILLILVTVLSALLAALIGNPIALFIIIPFLVAILMNAGFNKITSLAATVGAILVGVMGSIFGNDVVFISFLQQKPFTDVWTKVIFFILVVTLYVFFLLYRSGIIKLGKKKVTKKEENIKEEVKEIPLYDQFDSKKKALPLIIIFIITLLVIFIGVVNWEYTFGVKTFTDFYTNITEISWLSKLFGTLPVLGYFGNYDIAALLVLITFIIKWIYSIKFDEFVEAFVEGVKKMLKPAIYVIFASVIFAVMVNNSYNISTTVTDFILGMPNKLHSLMFTLIGFVGGFFFNDFPYLINSMYGTLTSYDSSTYTIMGILLQAGYSLAMLCLPVSVLLIGGLKYLNVSYKEWIKYIYQFLLLAFVLIIVFALIVMAI